MRLLILYIASFPGLHAQQKLHGHGGLGMIEAILKICTRYKSVKCEINTIMIMAILLNP